MTLGHIARLLSISNETTPKMEAAAHADGLPAGN